MNHLSEVVDSLENKIEKLMKVHKEALHQNLKLEEEIATLKTKESQYQLEIESWRDKCESLKLANSMLGSNQYKRETKLKINALVREIDQCISQLSE